MALDSGVQAGMTAMKPSCDCPEALFDTLGAKFKAAGSDPAILILSQSYEKRLVIPAGKQESSHKDVELRLGILPQSNTYAADTLPSWALDSRIHAGMTAI